MSGAVVDHCTAFAEGWWGACCAGHDADYLAQVGRLLADGRLADCVAHALPAVAAGHPVLAAVAGVVSAVIGGMMFVGVRIAGGWFYRRPGVVETPEPNATRPDAST